MNATPDSASPTTATAKDFMYENRGKLMVLQKGEAQPPRNEDFFMVESVGSHPTGLVITGVFEHNRRQCLRLADMRRATDSEIAAHKG